MTNADAGADVTAAGMHEPSVAPDLNPVPYLPGPHTRSVGGKVARYLNHRVVEGIYA